MRQINEELTGIEVSNLVTDEQEGEIVDEQNGGSRKAGSRKAARKQRVESTYRESGLEAEQSENILSESAEQNSNSLDEQLNFREPLFDDEDNLEDPDLQGSTKRRPQQKEKDDNQELSEYVTEQIEHPDEDGDEKVYRGHKNINLEPQGNFQNAPSESQNLPSNEVKGWMENLEFILDIPLQIDIQLGQTKIPLREVLEISSGSLIKLNKSENAPVELLINGKLVAEGQIVVTEENTLGVQVTSIVNRVERIRSLK